MKYTVVWIRAAEDELARLWTEAADRDAVRAAADRIDAALKSDPEQLGESRTGTIRVAFDFPVGVFFHVNDQDRLVTVLRVWRVP
jgi:hypothetical protein